MEPVEIIEHNGKTIELHYDQDADSPRQWDNLGTILYTSRKYTLGDKRVDATEIDEIMEREKRGEVIVLPVYAYIHSGIIINTFGFSCPWDSGQCGIIYAERDAILKEYSAKKITVKIRENVLGVLRGEIDTFSNFLAGNVYGYIIKDADGIIQDSCWGFIGQDYVMEAAKAAC
jgi:hypothetical protein